MSRVNPETEWQRVPVPQLAIVPPALFEAAQQRKAARSIGTSPRQVGRAFARPQRPFSGLLRCGCCGGSISISKRREGSVWSRCSTRQESGSCSNRRKVRIDRIEAAVFDRLKAELAKPSYVHAFVAAYHEEQRAARAAARQDRSTLEKAAARARAAYDRAHRLYMQRITDGPEAEAGIRRLLDELRAAEGALALAQTEESPVELHPAALDRYLRALEDLGGHLATDAAQEAVQAIRDPVNRVSVRPDGPALRVDIDGYLASLLGHVPPLCRETLVAEERLGRSPTIKLLAISL